MIEASELRIGNNFNYYPIGSNMMLDKVIALKLTSKTGWNRVKGEKSGWNQETQCHPILLTPETLNKCGYVICDNFGAEWTYIRKEDEEDFYFLVCDFVKVSNISIKYLHQLQNLYFALTGQEIEIKI